VVDGDTSNLATASSIKRGDDSFGEEKVGEEEEGGR
jgi:hypothetical protein